MNVLPSPAEIAAATMLALWNRNEPLRDRFNRDFPQFAAWTAAVLTREITELLTPIATREVAL